MPARFAEVRETAEWSAGFDPAWWPTIDALYAEYDEEVERVVRNRWERHAERANLAMQREMRFGGDEARRLRAEQLAVDAELAALERGFVARLERALPAESAGFLRLLAARMAFDRAAAHWHSGRTRTAAPIELFTRVLAGDEPGADAERDALQASPEATQAMAEAYERLAREAEACMRRRSDAYVKRLDEYAEAITAVEAREGELKAGGGAGKDADKDADKDTELAGRRARRDGIKQQWDAERRAADERLRLALVRESARMGPLVADPALRALFESQAFEVLHEGVFSSRSIDIAARMGRRALEREKGRDAAVLAEYDAVVVATRARQAEAMERLRNAEFAGNATAQQQAVDALRLSILPIAGIVRAQVGDQRFGRLTSAFDGARISLGDPDLAVDASFLDPPPQPQREPEPEPVRALSDVDLAIGESRDSGMRIMLGAPLSPRTIGDLAAALRLDDIESAQLEVFREAEAKRAAADTSAFVDRLEQLGKQDFDGVDPREAAREIIRELRRISTQVTAVDRGANARMLDEAVRLAGDRARDDAGRTALAVARLELDLETITVADPSRRDAEAIFGVRSEASVSPFEIVRRMRIDEAQREAVRGVILAREDELRAAAAAMRERMYPNGEAFLAGLLNRRDAVERGVPPFRATPAGADAAELRFRIADDLRAVLGDGTGDAFLEALRETHQPEMAPPRPASMSALVRLAAGVGLPPEDSRSSAASRAELAAIVDLAEAERAVALRTAHRWRAGWVTNGRELDASEDWDEAVRMTPTGALLRARIRDVDERAIAAAQAAVAADAGASGSWHALARRDLRMPDRRIDILRMQPWSPDKPR